MTSDELRELAHELHDRDEAYALITVVRAVAPTSAYVGAQAIVLANGTLHGWIGGGCAKNVVIRSAQSAIEKGEPKLVRISNDEIHSEEDVEQFAMACASYGSIELFIQPYSTQNLLCVLGDSPAANEARFLADRLRIGLTDDATEAPIVLVATQGQGDEDALETAPQGTAKHVLLIASRRKADKLRSVMRTRGIDENQLARLHAPAGPDAGAKTPEEIALAAWSAYWRSFAVMLRRLKVQKAFNRTRHMTLSELRARSRAQRRSGRPRRRNSSILFAGRL